MIERKTNWLGQARVDAPHLRALESSVASDFDLMAGSILAGSQPLVVTGFTLITTGAIGNPASSLQLNVAGGTVLHPLASEHGTIFQAPADRAPETLSSTNPNVSGGFTANQVNYVGLDLIRTADDTTSDLVAFIDASTLLENPKTVPLARTLNYRIVISTTDFASTPVLLPLAKVTTGPTNAVTAIQDARPMAYRLGSGGSVPNIYHAYPWAQGRNEATSTDGFSGGDKQIGSLKDWMDAVTTRIWEVGGGEHWYSPTADWNVTMIWTGATFNDGENFEWTGSNLHWKGLKFLFDNSTGYFNTVADQTTDNAGQTDLADGDCVYVDLDRTQNATNLVAAKGALTSLGTPTVPGSRYIIAWRSGSSIYTRNWRYAVGTTFQPATTTSTGVVKLLQTPGAPSAPVVMNLDANSAITWTATSGSALTVTGAGASAGISSTGGSTSGNGLLGTGGGPNGIGVRGIGTGTGNGGYFTSGTGNAGYGVFGEGNGGNTRGVGGAASGNAEGGYFVGSGTGAGVSATGGATAPGVIGSGNGNFVGVLGLGAGASSTGDLTGTNGVVGSAGIGSTTGTGGDGVVGIGNGSVARTGVYGKSNSTGGAGVLGLGGAGGVGGGFTAGTAATGSTPQTAVSVTNGYVAFSAANPNSNVGFSNTLTPANVAKAWGWITCGGSPSINDGFNIDTGVGVVYSGSSARITLKNALAGATGAIVATVVGAPILVATSFVSASVINFTCYDATSAGAIVPLNSTAEQIFFVVYGKQ